MLIAHVLRDKGSDVHTLPAAATLAEAAKQLDDKRVGALVVLDHNSAPAGVISERDIVRELARRGERS
jgi:CBS domain-containing protein